jgi:hypothetical protein
MTLTIGKIEQSENIQTFTHSLSVGTTILMIVDGIPTRSLKDGKWVELTNFTKKEK